MPMTTLEFSISIRYKAWRAFLSLYFGKRIKSRK